MCSIGPLQKIVQQGIVDLDAHRLDEVMKLFHPECVMMMPAGEEVGLDGIALAFKLQIDGFPDARQFVTPAGLLEPTGSHVTWRACDVLTFRKDKIVRWCAFLDLASIALQMGSP